MTNQRFEIVRQAYDRYSWLFVEVQDGQRRVLARGGRNYGSPKKVRRVIQELRGAVHDADVADATGSTEPERFALPATSFGLVPGVIPLVVEESPVERDITVARRRKPKRPDSSAKLRKRTEEMAEAPAAQASAAQAPAAQASAAQAPAAQAPAAQAPAAQEATAQEAATSRGSRREKRSAASG
jgi:hypothetical protein